MNAEQKAALEWAMSAARAYTLPWIESQLQSLLAELEAPEPEKVPEWQPIETAPKNKEIIVGRYVQHEWRLCQSGFYFDEGMNNPNGYEPSYWFWSCDADWGGVTEDEGPTHWMPIPAAPQPGEPS